MIAGREYHMRKILSINLLDRKTMCATRYLVVSSKFIFTGIGNRCDAPRTITFNLETLQHISNTLFYILNAVEEIHGNITSNSDVLDGGEGYC